MADKTLQLKQNIPTEVEATVVSWGAGGGGTHPPPRPARGRRGPRWRGGAGWALGGRGGVPRRPQQRGCR